MARLDVTDRTIARRYRAHLNRATPDVWAQAGSWYADARAVAEDVARILGTDRSHGAAVVAALSPRNPWSRNVRDAYAVAYGQTPPGLGANVRTAQRAVTMGLAALSGPKVRAFGANIAGDESRVTVDVWMMRASGIDRDAPTTVQYRRIERIVRRLAREYNVTPAQAQAAIWIVARGRAD